MLRELNRPIHDAITNRIGGGVFRIQERTGEQETDHDKNTFHHETPPKEKGDDTNEIPSIFERNPDD
jgi:hypothetical protein